MARTTTTTNGLTTVSTYIPNADVLTLGTIPVVIVPAQGVNTIIDVISVVGAVRNVSIPFATHTNLDIKEGGVLWSGNNVLSSAVSVAKILNQNGGATLAPNTDLTVDVTGGDPTAGDGDLYIYVTYQVYQLS